MNWFFWALLSAVFAGFTAILAKVGVAHINSNLATAIRTVVILAVCWGIAASTTRLSELAHISRRTWIFLGLSGITTGLSWLCYFRALQLGEVAKVAPIDKLSVIVTLLLAVAFLGGRLNAREICGVGFVLLGAALLGWK